MSRTSREVQMGLAKILLSGLAQVAIFLGIIGFMWLSMATLHRAWGEIGDVPGALVGLFIGLWFASTLSK